MDNLLLIFVKNPELGKVKTRLAKTIGDEKALKVYHYLLNYTSGLLKEVLADKIILYSDSIPHNDSFSKAGIKLLQTGGDLGERMLAAFITGFEKGYKSAVIIGSDCSELTSDIINSAFTELETKDIVIGPAKDGGYYLLGMNTTHPSLFKNKSWSTSLVMNETMREVSNLGLTFHVLPELTDIDEEGDLHTLPKNFAL